MVFVPCAPKRVPPELRGKAQSIAWAENPANREEVIEAPDGHTFLTVDRELRWFGGEVDLSVQFLDGPSYGLRRDILEHMNAWGETAAVRFRETQRDGTVRIARVAGDGHWSYVGTDVLVISSPDEPTMNLDGFTGRTPEAELRRVVRHETGHTLGFRHEHLRQELVGRLHVARTIQYFMEEHGWEYDDIHRQVLTPLEEASILGTADADELSIMTYSLPSSITIDGEPIIGGTDISRRDREFVATIYPLEEPRVGAITVTHTHARSPTIARAPRAPRTPTRAPAPEPTPAPAPADTDHHHAEPTVVPSSGKGVLYVRSGSDPEFVAALIAALERE